MSNREADSSQFVSVLPCEEIATARQNGDSADFWPVLGNNLESGTWGTCRAYFSPGELDHDRALACLPPGLGIPGLELECRMALLQVPYSSIEVAALPLVVDQEVLDCIYGEGFGAPDLEFAWLGTARK